MARRDPAHDRQHGFGVGGEIIEIDGIAIDRRIVVGRHGPVGDDVGLQDAPGRVVKRDRLGVGDRRKPGLEL